MTVRITKPAINLREGLKKSPSGIAGEAVLRSNTEAEAREALSLNNHETLTVSTDGVIADFESTGIDDNATSTAMTLDSSGNVGIGTSSPATVLDVSGSINATGTSTFGTGLANGLSLGGSSVGNASLFGTSANQDVNVAGNGTGSVKFLTGASGSGVASATERMRIDSSGNVGIGIAPIPAAGAYEGGTLHVHQPSTSASLGASLRLTNGNNGSTAGTDGFYLSQFGDATTYFVNREGGQVFFTANSEAMRIDSSGNVGIGTSSPGARLDVRGSAIFNDDSADADFRVESNNNANMLFVDAGNDRVGVNESAPTTSLHVTGTFRADDVRIDGDKIGPNALGGGLQIAPHFTDIDVAGGDIDITTGNAGTRNNGTGNINIFSSDGSNQRSGSINLTTGNNTGATPGDINLTAGNSSYTGGAARNGGSIVFTAGDAGSIVNNNKFGGSIYLRAGYNSAGAAYSGDIKLQYYDGAAHQDALLLKGSNGSAIFNEAGAADADFRVESDSNANMLFVDAGNDRVGIGTNSPGTALDVNGTVTADGLTSDVTDGTSFAANFNHTGGSVGRNGIKITSSGTSGTSTLIEALRNTTNTVFKVDGSGNLILNDQSGNQNHILNVTGAATFNDQGADADFRVESDTNTHALFVDAGLDKVGFGTSSLSNTGLVEMRGTYAATNTSDYRDNNALTLSANADPAADYSGINLAFVPIAGRGSTAVIAGENSGTNKEGGARLRFFIGNGAYPTTLDEKMQLSNSGAVFNENGGNNDFRVESDTNTHMLFVDASAEAVIIGNNSKITTGAFDPALTINANKNSAFFRNNGGGAIQGMQSGGTTGAQNFLVFYNQGGTTVGTVQIANGNAGTTVSYNTSSDVRLKENIADADDAGELIDDIQVRKFDWIENGEHQRYGMIAQELLTVAPEAVSGDPESDEMMGVDYSKLVPMLVKEIQSLRVRVHALESK